MPADLVLTRPGGADRPPLEITVAREAGGWTPAPYVAVEAGNQVELTADELLWIVQVAGPWALARVRELQDVGQPSGGGNPSPPSPAASPDEPLLPRPGSSVAGQGVSDQRPEPAPSSTGEA